MNTMDHGNHIPSFQFPPPRPGDGSLLYPPRSKKYVPQNVNYPFHGYHYIFGSYSTDTDTSVEDKVNMDVNPGRKKPGNFEPRGPRTDRRRQIQDQIAAYIAGLAKLGETLAPKPRKEKHPRNQVIDMEGTPSRHRRRAEPIELAPFQVILTIQLLILRVR